MTQIASRDGRLVGWVTVGLIVTGAIGYLAGGQKGTITLIAAVGLGVGTLALLLGAVTSLSDSTTWPSRSIFIVSVGSLFSFLLAVTYGIPPLPDGILIPLVIGGTVLIGVLTGYRSDNRVTTGILHGMMIGGSTGILVVFIAAQKSFGMRPALDFIVLISGVVAPLVFGVVCGISGGVGSLLRVKTGNNR